MARVLLVDDEVGLRLTLSAFLRNDGHDVRTAEDVRTAFELLDTFDPDVVVSDIVMPGESGVDLLARLHARDEGIAVVLLTGEPNVETASDAVRLGAFDYLAKPLSKGVLLATVAKAARAKEQYDLNVRLTRENERYRADLEGLVEARTAELSESEQRFRLAAECASDVIYERDIDSGLAVFHGTVDERLRYPAGGYPRTFRGWRDSLHPEDRPLVMQALRQLMLAGSSYDHMYRIRRFDGTYEYCRDSGRVIRSPNGKPLRVIGVVSIVTGEVEARQALDASVRQLQTALRGTISAVSTVVESRDPYTARHQRNVARLARAMAEELGLAEPVREGIEMAALVHDVGKIAVPAEILSKPTRLTPLELSLVKEHARAGYEIFRHVQFPWPIAEVIVQHHERLDGSGYPCGLSGDAIGLGARIVGVADVVEAMASHRPYRAALGIEAALSEISKNRGSLYDADVVDACLRVFRENGFELDA